MLKRSGAIAALVLLVGALQSGLAADPGAAQPAASLANLGSTRTLEVLPLVDWYVANPGLGGEAGVSYLVRTDRSTWRGTKCRKQ